MFKSTQNWSSKRDIFQFQQNKNNLESSSALFDHVFNDPIEFDKYIINYQVSKTSKLVSLVKQKLNSYTFQNDIIGKEIVDIIDWSIFHRQIFPAVCSLQINDRPEKEILDLVYCYSLFVVGPTQILDDKLDNPFAPELNLNKYENKKITELWAISDLMIRKGIERFLQLSPKSFNYIAPLTFNMTYSMYRENKLKNYNSDILENPQIILQLYTDNYSPDLSSIFNETMFIGGFIHLGCAEEDYIKLISLCRKFRLLRQQLNELEDFIVDLLCGFIKRPAALLLSNKRFGKDFGQLIQNQIWTKDNIYLVKEKSYKLSQTEYFEWIANQGYSKESISILNKSEILEALYHNIDKLCFSIVQEIEIEFNNKNCFDLLTLVYLKKALLERLNKCGFVPQKIINQDLERLNFRILE